MTKRGGNSTPSVHISKDVDGRTFRGWYTVQGGIVEVHLAEGLGTSEATQAGSDPPEHVATWLFDELVARYLAKRRS